MEDIRFTPSYHYLRFSHNDQNLRLIFYKTLTLGLKGVGGAWRSKRRRGRGGSRTDYTSQIYY